jgi:hypothetical protein
VASIWGPERGTGGGTTGGGGGGLLRLPQKDIVTRDYKMGNWALSWSVLMEEQKEL